MILYKKEKDDFNWWSVHVYFPSFVFEEQHIDELWGQTKRSEINFNTSIFLIRSSSTFDCGFKILGFGLGIEMQNGY